MHFQFEIYNFQQSHQHTCNGKKQTVDTYLNEPTITFWVRYVFWQTNPRPFQIGVGGPFTSCHARLCQRKKKLQK